MFDPDPDFIELSVTPSQGNDGLRLVSDVFEAQQSLERWRAFVALSCSSLAALSIPMAGMLLPLARAETGIGARFVLLLWCIGTASVVTALARRRAARRQLSRVIADAGARCSVKGRGR
jgi:hypothetical protein